VLYNLNFDLDAYHLLDANKPAKAPIAAEPKATNNSGVSLSKYVKNIAPTVDNIMVTPRNQAMVR